REIGRPDADAIDSVDLRPVTVAAGSVFVLGDSRSDSTDSRSWLSRSHRRWVGCLVLFAQEVTGRDLHRAFAGESLLSMPLRSSPGRDIPAAVGPGRVRTVLAVTT